MYCPRCKSLLYPADALDMEKLGCCSYCSSMLRSRVHVQADSTPHERGIVFTMIAPKLAVQLFLSAVDPKYHWVAIHRLVETKGYEREWKCSWLGQPCWYQRMGLPEKDLPAAESDAHQFLYNFLLDVA